MLLNMFIKPVEYLIEIIFVIMYRYFNNAGIAIVGVSLTVSFLTLPLYLRADKVQEDQRKKETEIKKWSDHIKRVFSGDERFMIQTAYYREKGYSPLQGIKGAFPLLLQIPFFIAAYHFLSTLELLDGCKFGLLADLGAEDGLIRIGGNNVNLLPILMTMINCISATVYQKKSLLKDKIQPYLLALIFLVLLYHSPSGLVFYWTLNNIFSLLKNIVTKYIDKPRNLLSVLSVLVGNVFLIYSILNGKISGLFLVKDYETIALNGALYIIFYIPLMIGMKNKYAKNEKRESVVKKKIDLDFWGVIVCLTVLCGAMIPLTVINSSPKDFVDVYHFKSPIDYVINNLCICSGLFIIWGGIIYWVCGNSAKKNCVKIFTIGLYSSVLNYFYFKANVGNMTMELVFDHLPRFEKSIKLINLLIIAALIMVVGLLYEKINKVLKIVTSLMIITMLIFTIRDFNSVTRVLSGIKASDFYANENRVVPYSKNGKNVVVIMLDRAVGTYVPFIFDEKPELKSQFDGFTYYPNTVSYGIYTNIGGPALFGGYDYTPEAVDARKNEPLSKKYNEALLVMPKLFEEKGTKITVSDLPYAGFDPLMDFSVFDDVDNCNAFHLEGTMSHGYKEEEKIEMTKRNFFFYSIYRIFPTIIQDDIYDGGNYLSSVSKKNMALPDKFINAYEALNTLKSISVAEDTDENTLFLYTNNVTHDPAVLQLPDYTVGDIIDNSGYDLYKTRELDGVTMTAGDDGDVGIQHYHCNMAAMLILGEYFDWMREQGVYDNTRIIIVSDHGRDIGQFEQYKLPEGPEITCANSILMVKDFDSKGFGVDNSFMTTADTPSIAIEGMIDNKCNPFTGNPISMESKFGGVNVVLRTPGGLTYGNTYEYGKEALWYHVKDNVYDLDNWVFLDK